MADLRAIRTHRARSSRTQLLRAYLALRAAQIMARYRGYPTFDHPVAVPMMGYRIVVPDFVCAAILFREVFLEETYGFDSNVPDPRVVDCGAHMGMSTLYFKWRYPSARVETFEPDPSLFKILAANVALNKLDDVSMHRAAVGSSDGHATLYTNNDFFAGQANSLLRDNLAGLAVTGVDVKTVRLSDFISEPVDFLKMDVEGAELAVVQELSQAGGLAQVRATALEFHHHISPGVDALGGLLTLLESAAMGYTVAGTQRFAQPGAPQQLIIRGYRKWPEDWPPAGATGLPPRVAPAS